MIDFFGNNIPTVVIMVASLVTSCIIVLFSIPGIILVAMKKRLLDKPNYRKKHKRITSNFGGLSIYSAFIFTVSIFGISQYLPHWDYIFAGSFILFVTGLKDDVIAITFKQKFLAQFCAAIIVSYFADVRVDNLHGLFGIWHLPLPVSIFLSFIGITFVTNAYNLIDGVDGLCGILSLVEFFLLGIYFVHIDQNGYAMLAFVLCGSILGFLYYNISPARIFMGDTGSLMLGFFMSILIVAFINKAPNAQISTLLNHYGGSNIPLALSIVIIPIFDTFRVFTTRILHKGSPFQPDRRHIHHLLIDAGFNANKVVFTLSVANIFFVLLSLFMCRSGMSSFFIILILFFVSLGLLLIVLQMRNRAMAKAHIKAQKENARISKTSQSVLR